MRTITKIIYCVMVPCIAPCSKGDTFESSPLELYYEELDAEAAEKYKTLFLQDDIKKRNLVRWLAERHYKEWLYFMIYDSSSARGLAIIEIEKMGSQESIPYLIDALRSAHVAFKDLNLSGGWIGSPGGAIRSAQYSIISAIESIAEIDLLDQASMYRQRDSSKNFLLSDGYNDEIVRVLSKLEEVEASLAPPRFSYSDFLNFRKAYGLDSPYSDKNPIRPEFVFPNVGEQWIYPKQKRPDSDLTSSDELRPEENSASSPNESERSDSGSAKSTEFTQDSFDHWPSTFAALLAISGVAAWLILRRR